MLPLDGEEEEEWIRGWSTTTARESQGLLPSLLHPRCQDRTEGTCKRRGGSSCTRLRRIMDLTCSCWRVIPATTSSNSARPLLPPPDASI